jgi:hypothetical protein
MVDFASTQAWTKEMAPHGSHEGGIWRPLRPTPERFTFTHSRWGGQDVCQLAEIHAITTVQLVECARWRQSDPTASPVQAKAGR